MGIILLLVCLSSCLVAVNASCLKVPIVDNTSNNASALGPFLDGTVVQFTCDDGYTPDGSRIYICSGSEWTNGNLQCNQIYCKHVDIPENGFQKYPPTYEVGSFLTFGCNEGYTMNGVGRLICRVDGEWNPRQAPVCKINNCGEFGDVPHGSKFQDNSEFERNTYGSVTKVTCDRGYVLNGSPSVTCDKDGNWGDKPVCVEISCNPYPGLNTSCIEDTKLSSSNLLFMVCKSDVSVTKTGPSYVRCSNNKWSPDPADEMMGCFCDCKVNVDEQIMFHNLNDGYLKHLETLDWSCKNNGVKVDNGPLKCYDGKMATPSCILPITNPVTYSRVTSNPVNPVTCTDTSTEPSGGKSDNSSNNSLIIILSVLIVVLLGLFGGLAWYCFLKKRKNDRDNDLKEISDAKQPLGKTVPLNNDKSEDV